MKWVGNERGAAMMVALGILLMLGLIGSAAVQTAMTDINISENFQHDTQSLYVAEAGIEHAFAILRDNIGWRAGLVSHAFAGGSYTVSLIDSTSNDGPEDDDTNDDGLRDTIVIYSYGFRSGARTTIEVKLDKTNPFKWSAYGKDGIKLCGTTYTDSYNSDSGSYGVTMLMDGGNIGSNVLVEVCGTADIHGDALSATPGGMDIWGNAEVYGDTTTQAPVQIFDPVPAADVAWAKANSSAPAGLSGNYIYNAATRDLTVKPNKTLTLASGTYYFHNLNINGNIVLAPNAKVKIYLVGDADIQAQAKINAGGKPANLLIFGTGPEIKITGGAVISSAVYAPDTEIKLIGGADLYGAYIGQIASDNGGSNFHYDRSLDDLDLDHNYSKVSWREL